MYWPRNRGNESNIFVLAKNTKTGRDKTKSKVYVSRNYGKNFTDLGLTDNNNNPPLIDQIYSSKADQQLVSRPLHLGFTYCVLLFLIDPSWCLWLVLITTRVRLMRKWISEIINAHIFVAFTTVLNVIHIQYSAVMSLLFVTDNKFNVYLEVLIRCKNGAYTCYSNLVSCSKSNYAEVFSIHNIESAFSNERSLICHSSTGNKFSSSLFLLCNVASYCEQWYLSSDIKEDIGYVLQEVMRSALSYQHFKKVLKVVWKARHLINLGPSKSLFIPRTFKRPAISVLRNVLVYVCSNRNHLHKISSSLLLYPYPVTDCLCLEESKAISVAILKSWT